MAIATCVECDGEIEISGRVHLGQLLNCIHCGARLEVVGVNPVEVDWAYDEEGDDDDWDDDLLDEEFKNQGELDGDDDLDDDYADEWDDLEEEEEWR